MDLYSASSPKLLMCWNKYEWLSSKILQCALNSYQQPFYSSVACHDDYTSPQCMVVGLPLSCVDLSDGWFYMSINPVSQVSSRSSPMKRWSKHHINNSVVVWFGIHACHMSEKWSKFPQMRRNWSTTGSHPANCLVLGYMSGTRDPEDYMD